MSSKEPIYIRTDNDHITDEDRKTAIWLGMETGHPVIVRVTPKPRWWQFWKRKKQK
jgi:hypothetical protein